MLKFFSWYAGTRNIDYDAIMYLYELFPDKLLTVTIESINGTPTDSCTILGAMFHYIYNADSDDLLTIACDNVAHILSRSKMYRYCKIDEDRNIYEEIQYFCNTYFPDNRAQLSLIAQIASYYLNNEHMETLCHVIFEEVHEEHEVHEEQEEQEEYEEQEEHEVHDEHEVQEEQEEQEEHNRTKISTLGALFNGYALLVSHMCEA